MADFRPVRGCFVAKLADPTIYYSNKTKKENFVMVNYGRMFFVVEKNLPAKSQNSLEHQLDGIDDLCGAISTIFAMPTIQAPWATRYTCHKCKVAEPNMPMYLYHISNQNCTSTMRCKYNARCSQSFMTAFRLTTQSLCAIADTKLVWSKPLDILGPNLTPPTTHLSTAILPHRHADNRRRESEWFSRRRNPVSKRSSIDILIKFAMESNTQTHPKSINHEIVSDSYFLPFITPYDTWDRNTREDFNDILRENERHNFELTQKNDN